MNNILSGFLSARPLLNVEDPGQTAYGASNIMAANDYQAYYRPSTSAPTNLLEWQKSAGSAAVAYTSLSAFKTANPGRETNSVERVGGTAHPYFVDYAAKNFVQNTASTDVWGRGASLPSEVLKAIYWPATAPAQPSARIGAVEWYKKPSPPSCGPDAPVYHRRNPTNGVNLYTLSLSEANNAAANYGFTENLGIAFRAETAATTGMSPVYRLYNPQVFDYLWTILASEKQNAMTTYGYTTDEGIGYYASTTAGACLVPIYRLVHAADQKHYYTASVSEKNSLVAAGMIGLLLLCLGAAPVTVSAAGDLHLGTSTTEAHVAPLSQLLEGDVRFVNLEGPITKSGRESGVTASGKPKGPLRFNAPPVAAKWLAGRVDVVSLANNHALDQGRRGLAETVSLLRARGIKAATASTDAVLERQGRKVRLLAHEFPELWAPEDEASLESRVREARETGPVLVSLHWGHTGALLPSEDQRRLAARLIDAGATAVLGHGPHTPQGIERRGRGVIAYSLGNLAFACGCTDERDAYVLRFRIDEAGAAVDVEALPLQAGLREAPRLADDPGVAQLLRSLSEDLGSEVRLKDGRVLIR